jgi:hypothetical protein
MIARQAAPACANSDEEGVREAAAATLKEEVVRSGKGCVTYSYLYHTEPGTISQVSVFSQL